MKVYTLTVEGTLIWDTTKDDLTLSAKYVLGKWGTKTGFKRTSSWKCVRPLPEKRRITALKIILIIFFKLDNLEILNWEQNLIQ